MPKSEWPKKRRHCWVVRWYGTNEKKRYGNVFKTRKEAERRASELQARVPLGKADKPPKITLHEFQLEHEQVIKGQVAYSTLYDQLRALRFFENYIGGSITLYKIQPKHAESFVALRLASGLSPETVNKDIRTLKHVFNLAIEPRGYLQEGQNPVRYMSVKEYLALMKAAEGLWWKALISVAYGSGLRHNEILNLTWTDIDFEHQQIHAKPKKETSKTLEWEPKDHENRVVPMSDTTAQLLADLQIQTHEGHAYVFVSRERLERIRERQKSGTWTPKSEIVNNVMRDFDVIRRRAHVRRYTLHDLRRSAITNWAQRLPIQIVQQLAGHADISTTRKYYLTVRLEDMASANELLNNILAGKYDD